MCQPDYGTIQNLGLIENTAEDYLIVKEKKFTDYLTTLANRSNPRDISFEITGTHSFIDLWIFWLSLQLLRFPVSLNILFFVRFRTFPIGNARLG